VAVAVVLAEGSVPAVGSSAPTTGSHG
jgi:hypothetical protein